MTNLSVPMDAQGLDKPIDLLKRRASTAGELVISGLLETLLEWSNQTVEFVFSGMTSSGRRTFILEYFYGTGGK